MVLTANTISPEFEAQRRAVLADIYAYLLAKRRKRVMQAEANQEGSKPIENTSEHTTTDKTNHENQPKEGKEDE
jgi:hypothetical protein